MIGALGTFNFFAPPSSPAHRVGNDGIGGSSRYASDLERSK